jgi:hypothetical protein
MDAKPSKVELYKQKLAERGMYDNDSMFDYFGRAGGGAPLRKANGDLQTTRRTLVNDRFEELSNPIYSGQQLYPQNTPNQMQYNNPNNNYYQEMNQYNQQFQTQNQQITQQQQQIANQYNQLPMQMNQNAYNHIPNGMYIPNVVQASYLQAPIYSQMSQTSYNNGMMNRNFSYEIPHQQPMNYVNNYQQQQQRNIKSARPNANYNRYNNINNSSTTNLLNQLQDEAYQQEQITIIPQPNSKNNVNNNYLEAQKQQLKNEWIQQIEEKKRRKEIEKQKEIEKDKEAEERWKKQMAYQEEIKQNMKQGKFKLDNFAPSPGNEFAMMTYINNPNNEINQNGMNINDNNNNNLSSSSPPEMNQGMQGMSGEYENQDNNNNNGDMIQSQQNMNYTNSGTLQYNPYAPPKENDTTMKLLEFSKLSRRLDDNINDQLTRLRNDVNNQYLEMSNLFGKLKQDVAEANQLRNDAERELNYVKDELMKQKMNNILYENKLNQTLEKHAPYNNLHIPYSEVNPLNNNNNNNNVSISGSLNPNNNLQSVSTHLYMNDMVNEGNLNQARELSSMAKLGQSLMNVSELVPIVSSQQLTESKVNDNANVNMNALPSNQMSIGFNTDEVGGEEEVKVMDEYQNNMSSDFKEMNNALEHIALLNQQLNLDNNVKTMNNNLDLELSIKKNDRQHQEEIKAMDDKLYHNQ